MAYIPLNKIVTNLYTNGEEYQFLNGDEYIGYYYKLYTGEIKTGKTPNNLPNGGERIYPLKQSQQTTPNTTLIPSFVSEDGPPYPDGMNEDNTIIGNNQAYTYLKEGVVVDITRNNPSYYYSQPTLEDYKIGVFTRYFCYKNNENLYLEIDKDTFDSLKGKYNDWNWENWTTFSIPWTLTGNEREVQQVNYNISTLRERRNKRTGFKLFLKYNYTKFYQPPIENNNNTESNQPSPTPSTSNTSNGSIGGY
jgi:hypothetical protein